MKTRTFYLALALASLSGCSDPAPLGARCDEAGKSDDVCEEGGVCGKETSGELVCLKICIAQSDCPADTECNGVEGSSQKGCRRKAK